MKFAVKYPVVLIIAYIGIPVLALVASIHGHEVLEPGNAALMAIGLLSLQIARA